MDGRGGLYFDSDGGENEAFFVILIADLFAETSHKDDLFVLFPGEDFLHGNVLFFENGAVLNLVSLVVEDELIADL